MGHPPNCQLTPRRNELEIHGNGIDSRLFFPLPTETREKKKRRKKMAVGKLARALWLCF